MTPSDEADSHDKTITKFLNVGVDYSDLLGQKVKVMFTKQNNVLGVYATNDNTVITANQKDVTADGAKVKVNGTSYSLDKDLVVSVDGAEQTKAYTSSDFDKPTSPDVLTLIDSDQDNKIDYIYVETVTVAKVTYATDAQIIAAGTTYRAVDNTIADGIAKDDWVIITNNLYNDNKDIVKAEMATGHVDATKAGTPNQYRIDGTWYNKGLEADNADISNSVREGVDAQYVAVNGILFYATRVTGTDGLQDVLFVTSTTASGTKAEVMYPNGATGEIRVSDKSDKVSPKNFYEYSKSGDVYKLTNINLNEDAYGDYSAIVNTSVDPDVMSKDIVNNGTNITGYEYGDMTSNYAIDDSADVIVYGTQEQRAKHITGKQLKALNFSAKHLNGTTAFGGFYSEIKGGDKATVIAVEYTGNDLNGDFSNLTSYANYGFITGVVGKVNGVIQFYMWNGTENVLVNSDSNEADLVAGAIVGYDGTTTDADGKITLVGASAISSATAGYIGWTDGKDFALYNESGVAATYDSVGDFTTVLYVNTMEESKVAMEDGTECYVGMTESKVEKSADVDNKVTNALWVNDDLLIVDTAARALNGNGVGTHDVNIDTNNMKGLKSFQFVNTYTRETYDNDFKAYNSVYTIGYDALTDGTLTIEWADSSKDTYSFTAGQNTTSNPQIKIVVDQDITNVSTSSSSSTGSTLTSPSLREVLTALNTGNATVTGTVPTGIVVPSGKVLTLKDADIPDSSVAITGDGYVKLDGMTVLAGNLTVNNLDATASMPSTTGAGTLSATNVKAGDVTADNLTTLLGYATTSVTAEDVTGTVNIAVAKSLTVDSVTGDLNVSSLATTVVVNNAVSGNATVNATSGDVTLGSVGGKLTVTDATAATVTGSVNEIDVAATKSATVGSVTNWTTAVVAGTLNVTGDITTTITLPTTLAGAVNFKGAVNANVTVNGASASAIVTFSGAIADLDKIIPTTSSNAIVKFTGTVTDTTGNGTVLYLAKASTTGSETSGTEINFSKITSVSAGFKASTGGANVWIAQDTNADT